MFNCQENIISMQYINNQNKDHNGIFFLILDEYMYVFDFGCEMNTKKQTKNKNL